MDFSSPRGLERGGRGWGFRFYLKTTGGSGTREGRPRSQWLHEESGQGRGRRGREVARALPELQGSHPVPYL